MVFLVLMLMMMVPDLKCWFVPDLQCWIWDVAGLTLNWLMVLNSQKVWSWLPVLILTDDVIGGFAGLEIFMWWWSGLSDIAAVDVDVTWWWCWVWDVNVMLTVDVIGLETLKWWCSSVGHVTIFCVEATSEVWDIDWIRSVSFHGFEAFTWPWLTLMIDPDWH